MVINVLMVFVLIPKIKKIMINKLTLWKYENDKTIKIKNNLYFIISKKGNYQ